MYWENITKSTEKSTEKGKYSRMKFKLDSNISKCWSVFPKYKHKFTNLTDKLRKMTIYK